MSGNPLDNLRAAVQERERLTQLADAERHGADAEEVQETECERFDRIWNTPGAWETIGT